MTNLHLEISKRIDGKYNVWRRDFLLPMSQRDHQPHLIHASEWIIIAVHESFKDASAFCRSI